MTEAQAMRSVGKTSRLCGKPDAGTVSRPVQGPVNLHIQGVDTHHCSGPAALYHRVARPDAQFCAARVSLRLRRSGTKSMQRKSSMFEKPVVFDSVT